MKFQTPFTFDFAKAHVEHNNEPSLTVPDMSLSVKEMIDRYVRGGIPPQSGRGLEYDEEQDLQTFDIDPFRVSGMDLSDITELEIELQETQARIAQRKAELKKQAAPEPTPPKAE